MEPTTISPTTPATTTTLIDLPLETLTAIAKLTGWSLEFRLTCKCISRAYAGPLYKYDTCVPRFYFDCGKAWQGRPASFHHIDLVASSIPFRNIARPMRLIPDVSTSHYSRYSWSLYGRVNDDVLIYEALSNVRLFLPPPSLESLDAIDSIELWDRGGTFHLSCFRRDFLSSLVVDDVGTIPLFPGFMPLLLGKSPEYHRMEVIVRTHKRFPFRLLVQPCIPSFLPMKYGNVLHTVLLNLADNGYPDFPSGWAFRLPPEHPVEDVSKIIMRLVCDKGPRKGMHEIHISGRALGRRYHDFPYPLRHDSGFIVIPRHPQITEYYLLHYRSPYAGFHVLYTVGDDPKNVHPLPKKSIYYFDSRVFFYRNGRIGCYSATLYHRRGTH